LLFVLVSGLGGAGFLVPLGAGLWANVERKRNSFALLRFRVSDRGRCGCSLMIQAALLAIGGSGIALLPPKPPPG
jgi:hypothetical protein